MLLYFNVEIGCSLKVNFFRLNCGELFVLVAAIMIVLNVFNIKVSENIF
jgi:hypothetical protein